MALHHHFPSKKMVMPIALADGDVIGQAKTGTGKTLAFGIPVIERVIAPNDSDWPQLPNQGKATSTCSRSNTRTLCAGHKRY
jgi:superfamily II DNA/RNA helicase